MFRLRFQGVAGYRSSSSPVRCSAIYCYDGDGVDPTTWKEVECNLGSCVKNMGPLDIQRYCLQGIIMNTCSHVDNTDVMSVSLQTIKTMLTKFFFFKF